MKKAILLVASSAFVAFAASSFAATSTFQTDGAYLNGANWSDGIPNLGGAGNTAFINAAAEYVPGVDLAIQNGSVLQINTGGSWIQTGGVAWIQAAGGSIIVNGGTFNQGSAGNIVKNASTVIEINGGAGNFNGNYTYNPASTGAFSVNGGGEASFTGEFQLGSSFTLNDGFLAANLFVFGGTNVLTINSGGIVTNGAATDGGGGATNGFYGTNANSYVNLTNYGTSVFFNNFTAAQLATAGWLTNGAIKFGGTVAPETFSIVEQGGGVLVTAVPEPSTYAAIIGLGCIGLIIMRRRKLAKVS